MAIYLQNSELERIIRLYKRNHTKHRDELYNAFYLIAHHLCKDYLNLAHNRVVDIEDCTQNCLLTCVLKVENYDPAKGKAFNYFTQICLNQFHSEYRQARHHEQKITNLKERTFAALSHRDRRAMRNLKLSQIAKTDDPN